MTDTQRDGTASADGGPTGRRVGIRQGGRGLVGVVRESTVAWGRGSPWERAGLGAAGVAGAALLGALLFGVVHIVGGAFHANPRAFGFGVGLSVATSTLLGGLAWLVGRLVRRVGSA
ncbi:MAG: hypothetical protein ACXWMX_00250 [Candidatus Limnocylindrales bacterium]